MITGLSLIKISSTRWYSSSLTRSRLGLEASGSGFLAPITVPPRLAYYAHRHCVSNVDSESEFESNLNSAVVVVPVVLLRYLLSDSRARAAPDIPLECFIDEWNLKRA